MNYTTPYYLERTTNGTSSISLESVLMEKRLIFVDKPVDSESINEIIKQILVLSSENKEEPITLIINCPGGNISDD